MAGLPCLAFCQRHLAEQRHLYRLLTRHLATRPVAPSLSTASSRFPRTTPFHHRHGVLCTRLHTAQGSSGRATPSSLLHTTLGSSVRATPSSLLHTTLQCPFHTVQSCYQHADESPHLRPTPTLSLTTPPSSVLLTTPPSSLHPERSRLVHPALPSPLHPARSRLLHTTPATLRRARVADPDYEIIYRFPYIAAVRLICRLKLYQTGITLAAVPATIVLQDTAAAAKVGVIGLFAAGMLYVMGEFFRRFVGLIYLHRDGQLLKIAHLTFWGGRRDSVVPVADILPFSELTDSPSDVYFKLRRYSSKETFYVSLRFGGVASRQKLEAVFGPIDDR